jgi:hypothetical protein
LPKGRRRKSESLPGWHTWGNSPSARQERPGRECRRDTRGSGSGSSRGLSGRPLSEGIRFSAAWRRNASRMGRCRRGDYHSNFRAIGAAGKVKPWLRPARPAPLVYVIQEQVGLDLVIQQEAPFCFPQHFVAGLTHWPRRLAVRYNPCPAKNRRNSQGSDHA